MDHRLICLVSGTGVLCFWLGYTAATWAHGMERGLDAMDLLQLASAGFLLYAGLRPRKPSEE